MRRIDPENCRRWRRRIQRNRFEDGTTFEGQKSKLTLKTISHSDLYLMIEKSSWVCYPKKLLSMVLTNTEKQIRRRNIFWRSEIITKLKNNILRWSVLDDMKQYKTQSHLQRKVSELSCSSYSNVWKHFKLVVSQF